MSNFNPFLKKRDETIPSSLVSFVSTPRAADEEEEEKLIERERNWFELFELKHLAFSDIDLH